MTHDLAAAVDVTDAMAIGNPQALLSSVSVRVEVLGRCFLRAEELRIGA